MIKICVHIPGRTDATCNYRATPLMALRKTHMPNLHIELIDRIVDFPYARNFDLAFFQRPSTQSELNAIRLFKREGIPVIVDYDDLLFDLPTDNPSYALYMNKQTQETIISIIREASCVWVSTKELKRCLQLKKHSLNERIYVVPNALDDLHMLRESKINPPPPKRRQPAILWRGSHTHERDVMDYTPELADVAAKFRKWSFVFAGWNPWFLTESMAQKQAICSGPMPVGEFMDFVYATGAQIGIVPLNDSRFNRCKSNIAWLEMSWGGAACLVPEWEEWKNPGCVTYRNREDFKIGLISLIEMGEEKRAELQRQSWEFITQNFMLSKVNAIRAETLMATVSNENWPAGYERLTDKDDEEVMELS